MDYKLIAIFKKIKRENTQNDLTKVEKILYNKYMGYPENLKLLTYTI